jgi:hypothetical protein
MNQLKQNPTKSGSSAELAVTTRCDGGFGRIRWVMFGFSVHGYTCK